MVEINTDLQKKTLLLFIPNKNDNSRESKSFVKQKFSQFDVCTTGETKPQKLFQI